MGTTTDDGPDAGVDSRQLLLVALCLVGLVTASFLAPVTGSNPPVGGDDGGLLADILGELAQFLTTDREPDDGPDQPGDGGGGEGDGGGVPEWLVELLRELLGRDDGGGDGSGEADCRVLVESNPAPGTETTVRVADDGESLSGVRVWFNDQYVGRTDDDGEVTGVVPYEERLNVTVQSEETCTFSTQPSVGSVSRPSALSVPTSAIAAPLRAALGGEVAGDLGGDAPAQSSGDDAVNSSSEVQVDGNARVDIVGEPYPNSTIELVARVGSAPIPDANVSVDGQRVGRTDAKGQYTLSVPDRDRITLTVSREPVSGSTTIDVWQLQIGIAPRFTVPGEVVTANVTTPAGPVSEASVNVGGQQVGTTAEDGRIRFGAPASVDGTVTAATGRQSASVPLWRIYALTAGASVLLVVLSTVSTAVVDRRSGRARARRVAAVWLWVGIFFVGYVVWELLGILGGLGLLALALLYRHRRALRSGSVTAAEATERYLQHCQRAALGVVSGLETLVDLVRAQGVRLVAWLRTLPRSVSGLAARLRAWLGRLPGRLRAALASLSPRAAAGVALAVLFVVVSTVILGVRGFVVAAALVFLAAVGWIILRYRPDRDSEQSSTADTDAEVPTPAPDADPERLSLRALWRRLARWVLPEKWHTRTPAEISRAAVDAGLPPEPVERLTEAFRDVEYGGGAERTHAEEAWRAYESLELAEEDEES